MRAGHRLTGIAQVAGNLLRLHHDGALVGEHGFFRRLGSKPLELLDRVAEKIRLALRPLDLGAMGRHRARPRTPLVPKLLDLRGLAVEDSKGVEQAAVRRGIHQRALVMLAVDLDQRHAQRFQGLRAQRLVIDEGTGAAVGKLHTTQNQLVFGRDVVFGHERAHRVAGGQLEGRGHLALLRTLAHQRNVAARAERKGEGIEQNGLAGAGLPREHGQAGGELDIESIDEDNVANREPGQHDNCPRLSLGSGRGSLRATRRRPPAKQGRNMRSGVASLPQRNSGSPRTARYRRRKLGGADLQCQARTRRYGESEFDAMS